MLTDRPQTAGLGIQPFQTVAGHVFIWTEGPQSCANSPFNCVLETLELLLLIYLFTYLLINNETGCYPGGHSVSAWRPVVQVKNEDSEDD